MSNPETRRLPDAVFWQGKSVLVTGHTGFKGSWLCLVLAQLGAEVTGLSLDPEEGSSCFEACGLPDVVAHDYRIDIRDRVELGKALDQTPPDLVFHLAAQSLVRQSYRDPLESFQTNILGTAHLLDHFRNRDGAPEAFVAVTSDKCYDNDDQGRPFVESDRLGGHDPYSASKAGAEIVAASMRASFFSEPDAMKIATARAGNVVGGGDFADDRLIPDFVRARVADKPPVIRNPSSERPWQHVLEPLAGYVLLAEDLCGASAGDFTSAWNFGPDASANQPVSSVISTCSELWPGQEPSLANEKGPRESVLLSLDSSKAKSKLNWQPNWALDETLAYTIDWYRRWAYEQDMAAVTSGQIKSYFG
ncbi:MAG: CDP-glucose 4,6-dehydratase [Hyphomicrobiales bacterium]